MSDLFQIPDQMLPQALIAHAKGGKDWTTFIAGGAMVCGVTADKFKAAFVSIQAEASRKASLESLREKAKGYVIPAKLLAILKSGAVHVKAHSISEVKKKDKVITESFTPKMSFLVTLDGDKGVLEIVSGKVGKRSANGSVGANSRISAFVAWQRGEKKGDKFKVIQCSDGGKKGYKVDGRFVPSRGKGGLAAFILKVHGKSHTAKILTDYGYSLD